MLGRALRRTRLHRDEQPPHHRRDGVHHRQLRGEGLHHLAVQSRPGCGVARPDAQRRAAALDGRRNRRLRLLRGRRRQRLAHPARAPHRRHGHALQLRHDRPTQGRAPDRSRDTARGVRYRCRRSALPPLRGQRGVALSLAGAALPRCPAAIHHGHACHRRHRRRDGAVRPGRLPPPDRRTPHHDLPGRSHDVRSDAQARRGNPQHLRHLLAQRLCPRRCAVPGRGQAQDDRLVGAGHPRVLRRYRRQRLRVLQQRTVARSSRHRRLRRARRDPHRRRGR